MIPIENTNSAATEAKAHRQGWLRRSYRAQIDRTRPFRSPGMGIRWYCSFSWVNRSVMSLSLHLYAHQFQPPVEPRFDRVEV